MKTETLIKATATVINLVSLEEGNVYVRIDDSNSYSGDKIKYGVVTQVLHNGETAVITALEHSTTYSGVEVTRKVFQTGDDLKIFHCTVTAWETHAANLAEIVQRQVRDAEKALEKAQELQAQVVQLSFFDLSEPEHNVRLLEEAPAVAAATE